MSIETWIVEPALIFHALVPIFLNIVVCRVWGLKDVSAGTYGIAWELEDIICLVRRRLGDEIVTCITNHNVIRLLTIHT